MEIQTVDVSKIKYAPYNPRKISPETLEKLKQSIEAFGYVEPIIVNKRTMHVVGGNQRLRALRELKVKEVQAVMVDLDIEHEKVLNIALNKIAGEWDIEKLQQLLSEMDDSMIDLTGFSQEEIEKLFEIETDLMTDSEAFVESEKEEKKQKETEEQRIALDKAFQQAISEFVTQLEKLDREVMFYTRGTAKVDFLKYLYFGTRYPRSNFIAYHKHAFDVKKNNDLTFLEGLRKAAQGDKTLLHYRTVTNSNLARIITAHYQLGVPVLPSDFPAEYAQDLYDTYAPNGRVLDPCHGWGGRLVGFLASKAVEYTGIDASPLTNEGVKKIAEDFLPYVEGKKVELYAMPFEDFEVRQNYYDLVFTSPPYFDVEKYVGGEQSHTRYSNYDKWRDGFYTTLIRKSYEALKKDGHLILNVGEQKYPLKKDAKEIASKVGFKFINQIDKIFESAQAQDEERSEGYLIFRK